uniref:Putative ficolin n=1 Tax=Aedes albopictus TaxID=7160 RepID=A0A1W7R8Q9_AEDAL
MICLWILTLSVFLTANAGADDTHPILVALNDLDHSFTTMFTQQFFRHKNAIEQRIATLMNSIDSNLLEVNSQIREALDEVQQNPRKDQSSTGDGIAKGSPVLQFIPIRSEPRVPALFEQDRFDGGWLVVMQRYDGSVNFNRTWAEYRNGFGMIGQEFWYGLEPLHQLTKKTPYELAVEMEDFEGNYKYARYDKFAIGPAETRYALVELGTYNGTTLGDSLTPHKGAGFSTYDYDDFGCSNKYAKGGWWYYKGSCYGSSLTGIWKDELAYSSICWMKFSPVPNTPLKFVRMMIRPIE